jgi:zinc protease
MLKNPRFEETKIELSRIRKNTEISRRNDDIEEIAEREFRKLVYGKDSPYAGTSEYETIKAVTRDDMVKFHRTFFRPQNIIIGVWGDFESREILGYLVKSLGNWAEDNSSVFTPAGTDFATARPSVNLIIKKDATQSVIMMGHMGMRRDHPDYFTALVISRILGAGWQSRFSRILRQEKGLAYSIWAAFMGEFNYPGPFAAQAQTQSERTFEAVDLMKKEIEFISEGVTDEELLVAKEGIINSEVFWSDTRDKIMERLLRYEYYGYPLDYPQKLIEGVKKVTKEDISRVAQKHIFPEKLTVLIVGDPEKFGAPLPENVNIIKP